MDNVEEESDTTPELLAVLYRCPGRITDLLNRCFLYILHRTCKKTEPHGWAHVQPVQLCAPLTAFPVLCPPFLTALLHFQFMPHYPAWLLQGQHRNRLPEHSQEKYSETLIPLQQTSHSGAAFLCRTAESPPATAGWFQL